MTDWLRTIGALFAFRIGPADVPHAPSALAVLTLALVVLRLLAGQLQPSAHDPQTMALASTGIELLLLHLLLAATRRGARFVQSATAMQAIRVVTQAIVVALLWPVAPLPQRPELWSGAQAMALALLLPIAFWSIAAEARVLRDTLEIGFLRALLLVLAMSFATLILSTSLAIGASP